MRLHRENRVFSILNTSPIGTVQEPRKMFSWYTPIAICNSNAHGSINFLYYGMFGLGSSTQQTNTLTGLPLVYGNQRTPSCWRALYMLRFKWI